MMCAFEEPSNFLRFAFIALRMVVALLLQDRGNLSAVRQIRKKP